MAGNRSLFRDVIIWDLNNSEDHIPLGGLMLTDGITNTDFRQMLDILLITSDDCVVQNEGGEEVLRDTQLLLPGNYHVIADKVEVSDEVQLTRVHSIASGSRVQAFTEAVRARDGRCLVSKVENRRARFDFWTGFEAAHIFPLAYEHQWKENKFGRRITGSPSPGGSINSVQNGMLLRTDLHQLFDQYGFSINPDNGYMVIFFLGNLEDNLIGQSLDRRLLDDPRRPPDSLLRWHFRQAVLANMRGAGEPLYEHDFPPGSDMMGEIMAGPKAAERMEFELFDRLARHMEIVDEHA